MRPEPVSGHQDLQQGILALLGSCRPAWGDLLMRRYSPLLLLVLAGCSQTPQSSSLPEPYIVFAEQDGYTLYESYQLVESQVQRLSSEGGELQLKEVKQVDPVPDGRLYLKDPEGKVKLLTTHENFGPAFFAESGAFSPDMQTVYTVAVKNQSQEGIYAIDLKSLNASLILSSSEMGFELIEGTILEASRSGELGFKAYQAQEVPIAREGNPEGTPFELTDQFYSLELDGERTKMPIPLGPRPGAGLEPEYRFLSLEARYENLPFTLDPPYIGDGTEFQTTCAFKCGKHTGRDYYALDFNSLLAGPDDDIGHAIVAARTGSVYKTATGASGYGNYIVLKHQQNYWTLYAHLNSCDSSVLPPPAKPEDPAPTCGAEPAQDARPIAVTAGQQIGTMGRTGLDCPTGEGRGCAHLHFVVRRGEDTWLTANAAPPVPMAMVGPYKEKGEPILPIFPRGEPGEQDDLVIYPFGPVPNLTGDDHTSVPCLNAVDFTEVNPPGDELIKRYYMTLDHFQAMVRRCEVYELIKDRKNYPPYPPELAEQFNLPPDLNVPGVWIEQESCKHDLDPDQQFWHQTCAQ